MTGPKCPDSDHMAQDGDEVHLADGGQQANRVMVGFAQGVFDWLAHAVAMVKTLTAVPV